MQQPRLFNMPKNIQAGQTPQQIKQISPLALYDAMNNINQLNNKAFRAQQMTQSNGWGGGIGVLGSALGGLLAGQFGQRADNAQNQYMKDAFLYEQQQARIAEAKQAEAAMLERQRELEDGKIEHEREMQKIYARGQNSMNVEQFKVDNRQPQQGSFQQQQFQQLSPEQQAQARQSMFGVGNQQPTFSPDIQAAVQTGAITPEQAQAAQRQKAIGGGQQSLGADARTKMGLLADAEKSLAQYKDQAFEFTEDEKGNKTYGDYKEFGSKFGNTNDLLNNAVDNLLRFESGASISDDERDQALDKYSPSMWRSDETNFNKIKMLENKIAELRNSLGGQPQQQQQQQGSNFNQANNTFFKYSGGQ